MFESLSQDQMNGVRDPSEQQSLHRKSTRSSTAKVNYSLDFQAVKLRDNRRGLKYQKIDDDVKIHFVQEVLQQKGTIKAAAEKYQINFSTAKAILKTFRKEGRIGKKIRRHHRNSCFLKMKKKLKFKQSSINKTSNKQRCKLGSDEESVQDSMGSLYRERQNRISCDDKINDNDKIKQDQTMCKAIDVKVEDNSQNGVIQQQGFVKYSITQQLAVDRMYESQIMYQRMFNHALYYNLILNEFFNVNNLNSYYKRLSQVNLQMNKPQQN